MCVVVQGDAAMSLFLLDGVLFCVPDFNLQVGSDFACAANLKHICMIAAWRALLRLLSISWRNVG